MQVICQRACVHFWIPPYEKTRTGALCIYLSGIQKKSQRFYFLGFVIFLKKFPTCFFFLVAKKEPVATLNSPDSSPLPLGGGAPNNK